VAEETESTWRQIHGLEDDRPTKRCFIFSDSFASRDIIQLVTSGEEVTIIPLSLKRRRNECMADIAVGARLAVWRTVGFLMPSESPYVYLFVIRNFTFATPRTFHLELSMDSCSF